MAESVLVDASFLIAALSERDTHHIWAIEAGGRFALPWQTCDAVLSESFHLLEPHRRSALVAFLEREALISSFRFSDSTDEVIALMEKYSDVPMSFADACLVRMSEILPDPILLTTDSDFRIYRRLGRKTVPCVMPE